MTVAKIKEIRARTGVGMMECKQALTEAGGDLDAAIDVLRKKGAAAAEQKAGRIAAEGIIATKSNDTACVLVEINCETDFVAKDSGFITYAENVADSILANAPSDLAAVSALPLADGATVESSRQALIAKIGENVSVRRFQIVYAEGGIVSTYMHGIRIGVLVKLIGGKDALGRDLAMHIAASRPLCISEQDMPAQVLEHEKAIFIAQAEESGKPANIVEQMVIGRMKKLLKERTLLGQPFVKNVEQTIAQLLQTESASVEQMVRFEVGEGIERSSGDFVAEVMAQAGGAGNTR